MRTDKREQKHTRSLWTYLNGFSHHIYGAVRKGFLGRWMTAYGRLDRRMRHGDAEDRPLTGWRQRVVRSVERNAFTGAFKKLGQTWFNIPMRLLGLFGLIYGVSGGVSLLIYNVYLLSTHLGEMAMGGMVRYGVIAAAALPLLLSGRPLSETLYRCRLTRLLLIWLLGVPKERFLRPVDTSGPLVPILSSVVALGAGIGSATMTRFGLWSWLPEVWHPIVVPLGLLLLAVVGMILTVPEAGVVLACGSMVLLWTRTAWAIWVLLAVIGVTWIGYLIQLLQAHRTLRLDLLDRVVLLLGVALLFGGLAGYRTGVDSAVKAVILVALLSLYFLIVNLMITRTHIKRCWAGVCLASVLVTVSMLARYINVEELRWLEGVWPKAGPVLANGFESAVTWLSQGDAGEQVMFLVLTVPLLCAFLIRSRRLLLQVGAVALMAADLVLVVSSGSRGASVALLAGLALFALLSHHRAMTVGLVAVPAVVSVWLWSPLFPASWTGLFDRFGRWMSSWGGAYADRFMDGIWSMIKTHPCGIGLGDGGFESLYLFFAQNGERPTAGCGNLYLDILVMLGIPGLLAFVAVIFFFVQKTLTGLRYYGGRADRMMLLGGLGSLLGVLLFGTARSMGNEITVFFGFWTVVALISAYVNVIRHETEAVQSPTAGTWMGQDFVGRME